MILSDIVEDCTGVQLRGAAEVEMGPAPGRKQSRRHISREETSQYPKGRNS